MRNKIQTVYLTAVIGVILIFSVVLMVNLTMVYRQKNAEDRSDYYAEKEAYIRIQVDRTIDLIRNHRESMPKEYSEILEAISEDMAASQDRVSEVLAGDLQPEQWLRPYRLHLPDLHYGLLDTGSGGWVTDSEKTYEAINGQAGTAMAEFSLSDHQKMVLFIPEEGMDRMIRTHMMPVIRNIELEDNGYVWVNEVISYDGGEDYARRLVHANLKETEGQLLSTDMEDVYGNRPYETELNGINEKGEIVFEYYFKKKDSDEISRKMTYAKLFEPFDWIVATGVHVDDMEAAIAERQIERRMDYIYRMVILAALTLALTVIFIWKLRLSAQNTIIRRVNSSLNDELVERTKLLQATNLQLQDEVREREVKEREISELNRNLEQEIMDRTRRLELVNSVLEEKVAEAESVSEAKSMYLSVMSHEMRTPLNAIVGHTQLLKDALPTGEYIDLIEGVERASCTLLDLINDILDVEKYAAGKMSFESIGFNLKETLEAGCMPFKALAENKGLNCTTMIDDALDMSVLGDPMKIIQLLNNLVSNAIKFTDLGEVALIARGEAGEDGLIFWMDIRDTGIGMTDEVKERLFKPFEQGSGSVARYYGGTGLGLNICKEIVQHYNGAIVIESEPGEGSTFHVKMFLSEI